VGRRAASLVLIAGLVSPFLQGPLLFAADQTSDAVVFTDTDQLIFDARQAIRQEHYDVAIHSCERIIQKDPKNMTALKIMGSAYALLNEPARSRHVFEYALQIDPEDPDIPKFLENLPSPDTH
jgi:Tfp pilus assembly protein PilF